MSLISGLADACTSDPKRKGIVSKEVNAARKAMLDAVREAGRKAAAAAAASAASTRAGAAGAGGGGSGGDDGDDDDDAELEFDAVLMEREAAFIALCRRVGDGGGLVV